MVIVYTCKCVHSRVPSSYLPAYLLLSHEMHYSGLDGL